MKQHEVVKVSDRRGWRVTISSPAALKTRRVGERCREKTSSCWCGELYCCISCVVVANVTCQIEAHEIHRGKGLVVRLTLVVALNTIQVTVRFDSVLVQFLRANTLEVVRLPTHTSLLPNSREDLRLDGYLEYPLLCHKGTLHLQTAMPSPEFEPRPNAIPVTNHYTG
ncbi:hypothetical protein TNCV_454821 [Trichonephila clavipes]|nr:hypothetical protein TNCV_454821 [Trichonephila clavipes]